MSSRGKQLLQLSLKSVENKKQTKSQETEETESVSASGKLLKD